MQFGLYPRSDKLYVAILDQNGNGITTTLPSSIGNVEKEDCFHFHQAFADGRLRVEQKLIADRHLGMPVLRFTHRLESEDGSFNGVVIVHAELNFLASFNDENNLGLRDFISIRHKRGELLVPEKGMEIRGQGQIHLDLPKFPAAAGTRRVPAAHFKENEPGILGWQKNSNHELVSYAGLSEGFHLAAYMKTAQEYRNIALAATGFLILLSIAALTLRPATSAASSR